MRFSLDLAVFVTNMDYIFQINKDNRKETEEQIRCALQSLMKPEEVEDELRKAIEGLNLEERPQQ